ncbi:MAG: tRNA uridine-5-carboxymethylaminomethyl(34) synthesis GTPase MnmE [Clostridia bacterium]|nr:tRNA uridine-5-carboxymethylaminomethyl(34) synthesis GTPase MnmE [Clostridia bacterium]
MEDTIAGIATAPGEAGISIVRMSGENAIEILKKIFVPSSISFSKMENRKLTYGYIIDKENNETIDEVLSVFMEAPYTYTKEDVVEINCHGGMIPVRRILELILKNGARISEKGEFTKRAFLNGRIDLSQAEAVIDMISSKTDRGFDVAFNQLEGSLSKVVQEIRHQLLEILAHVTVNIDYPDEDIEEITYDELKKGVVNTISQINDLIDTAETGKIIRDGLSTVIVGKPNVGKSSLLNALLNESRAIVTDVPGTTRDIIEEMINIDGIPLKIVDTAGIRETSDAVEKIGVEKTKEFFNAGDLIIFIINASEPLSQDDDDILQLLQNKKSIILINKVDLPEKINLEKIEKIVPGKKIIKTSIKQGTGIAELKEHIREMVFSGNIKQENSLMITNIRHKDLLEKSKNFLLDAVKMIEAKEALDFVEVDLRNAWEDMGEIIGETISEDIMNEIFSRFCLGK